MNRSESPVDAAAKRQFVSQSVDALDTKKNASASTSLASKEASGGFSTKVPTTS